MPAFNAEKYITESIETVINQTYQNWELIVIDDGSYDNTAQIVKEIQKIDCRIIYFYKENRRLGAARNSGFKIAKGEYIAFLDSDDLWEPEKLEKQNEIIKKENIDLVYTDGYILNENNQSLSPYPTISGSFNGDEMYKLQYYQNYIPVLSVLMKSEWINNIGLQGETKEILGCEDWDYWLRMAKNGAKFYGMPEKLFKYRVHEKGMSRKIPQMKLAEFTALYNNIDYRLLSKEKTYKRLSQLILENVPQQLNAGLQPHVIKEIKKILKIKYSLKYHLVYFILLFKLTLFNKYIHYIFHPNIILSRLKLKKLFIC